MKFNDKIKALVNHPDWEVRCMVARQGYALDVLAHDDNCEVLCEVVKQGYSLDTLMRHPDWAIRLEVAIQGYRLDVLVHDEHWQVRYEVAKQGKHLDILVHDPHFAIRLEVAKHGYGFEILSKDIAWQVKELVERLSGSNCIILETNFGTYKGNLIVYTWDNHYLINSGCYSTSSLEEWTEKCTSQLDADTATTYSKLIQAILEEDGL